MSLSWHDFVRLILPPAVFRISARLRTPMWEYVSDAWPGNDYRSKGWDDASAADQFYANWPAFYKTVCGVEPLTDFPWRAGQRDLSAHNTLMTYCYVLALTALHTGQISVLDWGGAFGHYAAIGTAALPDVSMHFTVKDRPSIIAIGRQLMPSVTFTESDDECFSSRYDLVIASNALQYSPDWKSTARKLATATERYLLVTVPIVKKASEFVVVQRPRLMAEYISWVFNRDRFVHFIEASKLTLVREFLLVGHHDVRHAPEMPEMFGFLFKRNHGSESESSR